MRIFLILSNCPSVSGTLSSISRDIFYPATAPTPEATPKLRVIMMIPARRTPQITEMLVFFQSMSRRLAASVPVQAPVPGSGIPTNKKRAKYKPLPAFS